MKDLVSIIIPVYNVQKYLERCITSIINQTYNNIEIILVDDGSTDKSGKMCDEWMNKDDRIVTIHKENGGLSSARNTGMSKSNGKYLLFVDSDDYIDLNAVQTLVSTIESHNADIVICNRYHFFESGKIFVKFKNDYEYLDLDNKHAIFEMNNFEYFDMSATCKLYKKDIFKEIVFPIGKISEDYFIMYKILDKAKKIVSLSMPLYYYYQRNGSLSKKAKINLDFVEASLMQCNYIEEKYPDLKIYVRSSFVSANMTSYNAVISSNGKVDKKNLNILRNNVKENYNYIKVNNKISKIKKIQAYLFIHLLPLYNIMYKIYKLKERT